MWRSGEKREGKRRITHVDKLAPECRLAVGKRAAGRWAAVGRLVVELVRSMSGWVLDTTDFLGMCSGHNRRRVLVAEGMMMWALEF